MASASKRSRVMKRRRKGAKGLVLYIKGVERRRNILDYYHGHYFRRYRRNYGAWR